MRRRTRLAVAILALLPLVATMVLAVGSRDFVASNSDYVHTHDPCTSWPESDFTLAFWVRLDDGQGALWVLAGTRRADNSSRVETILLTGGELIFHLTTGNTIHAKAETNAAAFSDGQTAWTHIAFRQDWTADQMDIFVNGTKQTLDATNDGDTSGLTAANWTAQYDLVLGALNYNGSQSYHMDGQIADFRRYSRALSDAEIAEIATGNMRAVRNGLVAQWLPFGRVIDAAGSFAPTNHGSDDSSEGPPIYGSP